MNVDLSGRTALITGAAQGIGLAIAQRLYEANAHVILLDKQQELLNQIANQFADASRVETIHCDMAKCDQLKACVSNIKQIDFLINNAGTIGRLAAFTDLSQEDWLEVFNTNIFSTVTLTRAVLAQMQQQQSGRIIFVSSERAIEPLEYMSHYASTKACLLSIAKSLANEVGRDGIRVNSISPGVIPTPSWDNSAAEEGITRDELASRYCRNVLPDGNLGKPEDVADLVCYLCSDGSRWINGTNIRLDGGSVQCL